VTLLLAAATYYRWQNAQQPSVAGSNAPLIKTGVSAIHFGYNNVGSWSGDDWVETLLANEVNVLGILETDGMRTLIDNRDITEWLADKLHWYSDFGPTSATNTWGCAFLSAYPIEHLDRIVMPSPEGELACLTDALLRVNGSLVRVIASHFGNTEDVLDLELQTQYVIDMLGDKHADLPTIFTSYITSDPYSERHCRLLQTGMQDSTNSLDRYCLYTMYRNIDMVKFDRVDAGGRSDTELQV
jgi:hypothetical protein